MPEGSSEDSDPSAGTMAEGTTGDASTSGSPPTTTSVGDTGTGGAPSGACDPQGLFFFPQASISFDFAGQACSMTDSTGTDPQLVFDVRNTGLTDITARGMSMSSSSTGTFVNPQAVVGISPDVPTTVQASNDADGTPVTLVFQIRSKGPFLEAEVTFGG